MTTSPNKKKNKIPSKKKTAAQMHRAVIPHAVAHLLVFAVFLIVYYSLPFENHFCSAQAVDAPLTPVSPLYFAVATHTALGDNSAFPKTNTGKCVASLHAVLAWAITLSAIGTILWDS